MMTTQQWELLSSEAGYRGYLKVFRQHLRHTLFRGGWSAPLTRELLERGDCVAVVPYDPVRDCVVLIEQFRIGAARPAENAWLIEIVAGVIEAGETPEAVAHRELYEEAGCTARHLLPIGAFYTTPGVSSEKISVFLALIDSDGVGGIHGLADEQEDIRVQVVPFDQVQNLLAQGRINSAIPLIGLQWLLLNRERLRREFAGV